MLELLAPAGSPEALAAAVEAGADAVYLGFGAHNARRGARNFSPAECAEAIAYCHLHGVKVYITLNTLMTDRELPAAAELVCQASEMGADAVLIQDLGLLRAARQAAPDLPLHASTQMSLHSIDGVKAAADLGLTRAVLARELPRDEIRHICAHSPIEIEVFVHGALCMCYSGQCYMSSVIGGRSGNRGMCAQPCRLPYHWPGGPEGPLLSLKDLSLASHLQELEEMGVACVKLEGRMRRPEYVSVATAVFAAAIREHREPTAEELRVLQAAFSRQGFTDGYYREEKTDMFGARTEADAKATASLLAQMPRQEERRTIPVSLHAVIRRDAPATAEASDEDGHRVTVTGPVPEAAVHRGLTVETVERQLAKTGGTAYRCAAVSAQVEDGLSLPVSALNALRRDALDAVTAARTALPPRQVGVWQPEPRRNNRKEAPALTVSVSRWEQITEALLARAPERLYVPLGELTSHETEVPSLLERLPGRIVVLLPRILWDREWAERLPALEALRAAGITEALTGNPGPIAPLQALGFTVRGDFGLNIANSSALQTAAGLGLASAALSFELRLAAVRDLSKCMDTELIGYGRLPLMITEQCLIRRRSGVCACDEDQRLTDRTGAAFPVVRADGCRNEILNCRPLFLADRRSDWTGAGLWALRLRFTTEEPETCVRIIRCYNGEDPFVPEDYTRGLYYREVE